MRKAESPGRGDLREVFAQAMHKQPNLPSLMTGSQSTQADDDG